MSLIVALAATLAAREAHARAAAPDRAAGAAICLQAADAAARRHGAPREVMRALTRTETGRALDGALQPWPWTVNMEGAGHWFDNRAEALAYVRRMQAEGARSFDIGCFQVNHRWHGEAFDGVDAMFEPSANADYAARFLVELHAETGDWTRAAGLYHSRTPELRDRYAARFQRVMAGAAPAPAPGPGTAPDDGRPGERRRGRGPLIVRVAAPPAHMPANPGGVAIAVLRGGVSPLQGATTRPLID